MIEKLEIYGSNFEIAKFNREHPGEAIKKVDDMHPLSPITFDIEKIAAKINEIIDKQNENELFRNHKQKNA